MCKTAKLKEHYENDDLRNSPLVINATDGEFELMQWKLKVYSTERMITNILATCGIEDKIEACKLIEKICWEILGKELK